MGHIQELNESLGIYDNSNKRTVLLYNSTTGDAIKTVYERTQNTHEQDMEAWNAILEVEDDTYVISDEEKVERSVFKLLGRPYIEQPDEKEELFLEDLEFYNGFAEKYGIVNSAYHRLMGGLPYSAAPPEIFVTKGKPKNKLAPALYLALALGSTILVATGYRLFDDYQSKQKREEELEDRINPLVNTLTREGYSEEEARDDAIEFDKKFKEYAPYNQTLQDYAKFYKKYPLTTSSIFELTNGSFPKSVSSLKEAEPTITTIPAGDQRVSEFVSELKNLNSALFVLNNYYPYIEDGSISDKTLRDYVSKDPDLFKVEEYVHPLADPDEDWQNNISEMKLGEDIFFGVGNFTWAPTRIVNDKVYDGSISVKAKSLRGIKSNKLEWTPVIYDHLSKDAFPEETKKTYSLTPSDEYLVNSDLDITNIIGGREYEIKLLLEDNAGNEITKTIKTPYIREFENLGKQLYDKGLVIGVSYFLYSPVPFPWETGQEPSIVHPLLGRYDGRNQIVHNKHIDWATGHGINCFFLGWGEGGEAEHKEYHENYVNLVSSPMINQINISILYETIRRIGFYGFEDIGNEKYQIPDSEKWKGILDDFKVLNNIFFNKENYLKIKDKPVVYCYNADALVGKLKEFLDEIRSTHNNGIFLFTDHANPGKLYPDEDYLNHAKEFDGLGSWAGGWGAAWYLDEPRNETYPRALEEGYKLWSEMADKYEKVFIPSMIPGFVELRDSDYINLGWNLPRDLYMFSKEIEICVKYATPIEGKKIIRIDTWSDFGEGDVIEPTIEERFAFLEAIKKFTISYLEDNK